MNYRVLLTCAVVLFQCLCCTGSSLKIGYIAEESLDGATGLEYKDICHAAQELAGLTNGAVLDSAILAWCIKKAENDKPPLLFQEALVLFKVNALRSSSWVLAYVQRRIGAVGPAGEAWRKGPEGKGMGWAVFSSAKPDADAVAEFALGTNFAGNECRPFIVPIYAEVYAPNRRLFNVVSSGLSSEQKKRRYESYSENLSDPRGFDRRRDPN